MQSPLCVTVNLSFPVSPFFHGLRILLFQAFFQTFTVLFQLGSKFRMFFQNLLTDTASAFLNQFQDMSMFFVQFFWKFIDMQLNSVQDLIFVQSTKGMPVFEMLPETFVG